MGLFRRKREPFLTASPDAPVPGMSATSSVASAEVSPTGAPVDDGPAVVAEPFSLDAEGWLAIPDKPGLGVAIDRDKLARYSPDVGRMFA